MTKALWVIAKASCKRLDNMVFTKEALKAIAEQSPEEYIYDEETGELLTEVTLNISGPMWREHSHIGDDSPMEIPYSIGSTHSRP
jgi:hypothetical protein